MGFLFFIDLYIRNVTVNWKIYCLTTQLLLIVECLKDVELFTLWAEETLIEDNLVLDILFLAYYDSFCTCSGEIWKKFCSLFKV